jgi:hypothetical protein
MSERHLYPPDRSIDLRSEIPLELEMSEMSKTTMHVFGLHKHTHIFITNHKAQVL